jgi:hypothetical protein
MNTITKNTIRGIPRTQGPQERFPPKTLVQCVPIQFLMVAYADHEGSPRRTVALKVDGQIVVPPDGEEWANKLRLMSEWLAPLVDHALESQAASAAPLTAQDLPKVDRVSILGK